MNKATRERIWLILGQVAVELRRLEEQSRQDDQRYGALRCYWPREVLEADIARRKAERGGVG